MDKRQARKAFKSKQTPRGIFAIRCRASEQTWLGSSTHLDSEQNRAWFELCHGMYRNPRMQAAWNAHGETAFAYEILETFDDDLSPLLLKDAFAERLKHWEGALGGTERLDSWRS